MNNKGVIRFVENVLLDVMFTDEDVSVQVPFAIGAWHPVKYLESDGSTFYNIVFPDGSRVEGVNSKILEKNRSVEIVEIESKISRVDAEVINVVVPSVDTALFDGLSRGE